MREAFLTQLDKVNTLLQKAKIQSVRTTDSISLISANITRPKASSNYHSSHQPKKPIKLTKQGIPSRFQKILQSLFKAKCENLQIQFNQKNWQTFTKAFFLKNKIVNNRFESPVINLNDFYFQEGCVQFINMILQENKEICIAKLSKNYINPINLIRIQAFKELYLCNCKLGNDILEKLFVRLSDSVIEKLSLSSPEIKNRNQLTKYGELIKLIQTSSTLHTLELSNIQIHPESSILQSCRFSCLKHIDLSDNSNVRGICPTILSLNLSRNSIIHPFHFPIVSNEIQYLNLSYNKIPYYHFKQFLKLAYFPCLKELVLDHIRLDGDISAIQFYLEQSLSLVRLSMVDCDLTQVSYMNISMGIKHSRSLEEVDLTRNRVMNEKVAEHLSSMLQSCLLKSIKMRHCDIKDKLGSIILTGLHKNRHIEKVDMMNNLLGDETAKTICSELKQTKSINCLLLQENIIKYKDMVQINSYLQGNKYFSIHQLDKDYRKLRQVDQQIQQANLIMACEGDKLTKLEKDTQKLHLNYINKYKQINQEKKDKIKAEIKAIRTEESQIIGDMNLRQSLPSMTDLDQSLKESLLDNF